MVAFFAISDALSAYFEKFLNDPFLIAFLIIFGAVLIIRVFYDSLMKAIWKHTIDENHDDSPGFQFDVTNRKANIEVGRSVFSFLVIGVPLFYFGYIAVLDTTMQGHMMQWLNLIVRWIHVVVGIMWIGASFYFIFLENNLNRTDGVRDELAGNLWAIHGGGFYFLEKYKVAPKEIPKDLHWFKYEAYLTWVSGFALLWIVYYMNPDFLLGSSGGEVSVALAIGIGIAVMAVGWIIYDQMCKSWLIDQPFWFTFIGLILFTLLSYGLVNVLSDRAAFIHVGALIGTIMAANVFYIIIPSQKALVRAAVSGEPRDPTLGKKAMQRSLHNNYFTLPVIFIMISNHFPSTYGHEYNWLILMGISIASAGIKHFWNLADRGEKAQYILPMSVAALIAIVLVTSPLTESYDDEEYDLMKPVSFEEVHTIINTHCIQCHADQPSDRIWQVAPAGVKFDSPQQIQSQREQIMRTTVRTHYMPLGNQTNMTEEERLQLHRWIAQGADLEADGKSEE